MSKGINKKYELSEELSDFMKKDKASRPEIVKKIWAYIKKHDLQDPDDRRMIIPDDTLGEILGSRPVNMMKLASKISDHLFE